MRATAFKVRHARRLKCTFIATLSVTCVNSCKYEGDASRQHPVTQTSDLPSTHAREAQLTGDAHFVTSVDVRSPRLKVLNVTAGGTINSGFLVGSATDDEGVDHVELKVDDAPFRRAEGTTSWSFKLPHGTANWRRGTVHLVQARAIDINGNASEILRLTIVKGINRDLNGDGFADLAVGASGFDIGGSEDAGRIYVFHGSPSGVHAVASSTAQADSALDGTEAGMRLGHSLTVGDFNGDGYADLAAGEPAAASTDGRVYILHGSSRGISSGSIDKRASITIRGKNAQRFAASLTSGDFNGDGYDDLAASQELLTSNLFIFSGSAKGLGGRGQKNLTLDDASQMIAGSSARFGSSLAVRDVNDDGYADLAVGEWTHGRDNKGAVFIHLGSKSGLAPLAATKLSGTKAEQGFGRSVSFADINGDSFAELLVGSHLDADSHAGRIDVFTGHKNGIVGEQGGKMPSTTLHGEPGMQLGGRLTSGDLDNDGFDDIIAAAKGQVFVVKGGPKKLRSGSIKKIASGTLLGRNASDRFGAALDAAADYNHDGRLDLVVTAPQFTGVEKLGRIYLFYSNMASFSVRAQADAIADLYISGDHREAELGSALVH